MNKCIRWPWSGIRSSSLSKRNQPASSSCSDQAAAVLDRARHLNRLVNIAAHTRSLRSSTTCCRDRRPPDHEHQCDGHDDRAALAILLRRRNTRFELRLAHARAHDAHDADHQDQHQAEQPHTQALLHGGGAHGQRRNRDRNFAFPLRAIRLHAHLPGAEPHHPQTAGVELRIVFRALRDVRRGSELGARPAQRQRHYAHFRTSFDVLRTSTSATPGITTGGRIATSRR